ncbi:the rab Gtpase Sec4p, the Sec2p Gef Domain, and phosphate complex, partial [Ascoidea rubescens DSM 1968]
KAELLANTQTIRQLKDSLEVERTCRTEADQEVINLSKEIEDLSTSLFSEANNMVVDARRETESIDKKNTILVNEIKEKD